MDRNDKQAIENLFERLATVARQSPQRDAEADAFIRQRIADQPGASYYMAQTILVQEQALAALNERSANLETQASGSERGLLSGMFGDSRQPARSTGTVPRVGRPGADALPAQQRGSGGFLAGAAQTALGVTGGLLLGNAIAGMFGGDEAEAQTADGGADEPQVDDADHGGDFDGGDFGDFDV